MPDENSGVGELTPKQARFIDEWFLDFNGKQAAIRSGYAENSAEAQASTLLRIPKVMCEINKRQAEYRKKNKIKKDEMIALLTAIVHADIKDYLKFNGKKLVFKSFEELTKEQSMAIESIKMGRNGIELKLHGKSWSADMLNKHLGNYEADNTQKDNAPRVVISLPDNGRGKVVPITENQNEG